MEKKEVRRKYRQYRDGLTEKERKQKSLAIKQGLFASEMFLEAEALYTYVSYGTEVETKGIIKEALAAQKRVFVPKVYKERRMEFFEIHSLEELGSGFRGILEPEEQIDALASPGLANKELMLLPGLAFDMSGNRLGYGGGYYDAYLARFSRHCFFRLGLCFECQLLKEASWQIEARDAMVDTILTENGFIR